MTALTAPNFKTAADPASITASRTGPMITGAALIVLAVGFNLPFAWLARNFDYPAILRRPADEILTSFTAGGPSLILAWYAFALAALLFLPVGMAHAMTSDRIRRLPALAVAASIAAALSGLLQAMGLLRWVMVVPGLALADNSETSFAMLHAYAGVALGEHLGQLLTAFHVGLMAAIQLAEKRRLTAALGAVVTLVLVFGSYEGVALAIGADGAIFGTAAILGYLGLTLWLILSGLGLLRRASA
jgi:hypothetical protein